MKCPFRKKIVERESITEKVTVREVDFAECYGAECPYFDDEAIHNANKCSKVYEEC